MSQISFGYERQGRAFLNDSKILDAYIYYSDEQNLVDLVDLVGVTFTVLKPTDDPGTPTVDAAVGQLVGEGKGQYVVDGSVNDTEGEYRAFATFEYQEGGLVNLIKTVPIFYDVVDPFERTGPAPSDPAVDACWLRLEDCFDSEFGGPWLRDMTMRVFDKTKVRQFVGEALLQINETMPYSDFTEDSFPYANGSANMIMTQALLCSSIRHLMRSYTEQPDVTSSPVGFMDRKRYQQAWKAMYDIEEALFERWLRLWKLRGYDMNSASLLVGQKAGRYLPASFRSRNIARGF